MFSEYASNLIRGREVPNAELILENFTMNKMKV